MNTDIQKTKLLDEKNILEQELGGLGVIDNTTHQWEATPEAQTSPEADMNDLSDRAENFEEKSSTLEVLSSRLADVSIALANIEAGTYGVCTACGSHIEEDRLEANPAAQTSKACMNKVM